MSDSIDILLVEDVASDADLVIRALNKTTEDLQLKWVEDGAEALDFIFSKGIYQHTKALLPKLILLDLNMPKISGPEVLRRIRSDERTRAVPVVVLTSSREDKDVRKCYELGVNSYIVKPVDFIEFTKTISALGHYWLRLNLPSQ